MEKKKYVCVFINSYIIVYSIGTEVGMSIGDPQGPYKSLKNSQNTAEITDYFRSKKSLKLIIVIIPDRTDATYGKDSFLKYSHIHTHILNFKLFICFRQSKTDY